MKGLYEILQGVEDPRRSNATRHDLHEMLMIGLLSMLTGGRTCVDMESFGRAWEPRLREFMKLGHGIPSHDAFSKAIALAGRHVRCGVFAGHASRERSWERRPGNAGVPPANGTARPPPINAGGTPAFPGRRARASGPVG